MKKLLASVLAFAALAGTPSAIGAQTKTKNNKNAPSVAAPKFGNTEGITAAQLRNHLEFIASDEMEGRDTPSRGLDISAMYIASHLLQWGIKPAGDGGTYFQKFPLKRGKIDAANTRMDLNGRALTYGDDFLVTNNLNADVPASNIVYAGNGWVVKSKNINAYQGIDVKDKIVVVVSGLPKGVTNADLQAGKPGVDWFSPPLYAQQNGARAVIYLPSFSQLANWQLMKISQSELGFLEFKASENQVTVPIITASPRFAVSLFQGEKSNGVNVFNKGVAGETVEPFDLNASKKISLKTALKTETVYTQNVVGILEGSDPVLKNEYVAVGAHYDHVGMNPNAPGPDKIWNGADDDGSGTVSVMAIAEAFSKGARPKRSLLFIWHAGEEKGLWGSEYFADNPTVPISQIITELNIDMIGRYQNPGDENHPVNSKLPKPGEVFVIGSKMMSTELGEVSEATNKAFLNLNFNYKYDDPNDPERFFYRSDHYNYARKGVPIIFYMDGVHADYHQASDSVEKINFEQMEKVARTIFATGWELANRPMRPKVDKPLAATN